MKSVVGSFKSRSNKGLGAESDPISIMRPVALSASIDPLFAEGRISTSRSPGLSGSSALARAPCLSLQSDPSGGAIQTPSLGSAKIKASRWPGMEFPRMRQRIPSNRRSPASPTSQRNPSGAWVICGLTTAGIPVSALQSEIR